MSDPEQFFLLIAPASLVLLGLAFFACWRMLRQEPALLWLGAGYILPALSLGAQSLMLTTAELAQWSVPTAMLYLTGAWCVSHGMALRSGAAAPRGPAIGVSLACLALLHYYSAYDELLWARICVLNVSIGLLQLLPMRSLLQAPNRAEPLEKAVRWSYVLSVAYTFVRPVIVLIWGTDTELQLLTQSLYWRLMLGASLLLSIWFALMLLAAAMHAVISRLHEERNRDALTHLLNRRAFAEAVQHRMPWRTHAPWALLMCDIDHFKHINDTWGHAIGDQVLKAVARTLQQQVRDEDLVARFGGEEFVILLCRSDLHAAERVAQRIRGQLARVQIDGAGVTVTASFGLVPVASPSQWEHALNQADKLLYQAKEQGRDRICTAPAVGA